ncbi:hypothetical protein SRHO_G00312070 [Serrasalmus rhombeus]
MGRLAYYCNALPLTHETLRYGSEEEWKNECKLGNWSMRRSLVQIRSNHQARVTQKPQQHIRKQVRAALLYDTKNQDTQIMVWMMRYRCEDREEHQHQNFSVGMPTQFTVDQDRTSCIHRETRQQLFVGTLPSRTCVPHRWVLLPLCGSKASKDKGSVIEWILPKM